MLQRTTLAATLAVLASLSIPASAQRPVMESVRPSAGPPGSQVQLIGRHFGHRSQVFLGDVELRVVERLPNRLTVEIPTGARTGPVLLRTRQGTYAGPRFRVTAARPAPEVQGLEPGAAPPGSEVRIVGRHFSARLGDVRVTLAGRPVVVRSASPTALRVITPANASSGTFQVHVAGSPVVAESPRFEVTVGVAITAIEPSRATPGSDVTLHGTGFSTRTRENRVRLSGRGMRVLSASPTELRIRLPRRGVASGRFELDVTGAGHATSPPFEVAEPVDVAGFTPTSGPPGTEVTIRGSGFGRDVRHVQVTIGGRPLRVRSVDPHAIVATLPSDAPSGQLMVSVGGVSDSSRGAFSTRRSLTVQSFQPTRGAPGTEVTIRGQGFDANPGGNLVTLAGVRQTVLAASPEELRVRIVQAASAPFEVRANRDTARSGRPFVVDTPPFIARFEPRQGPPGTQVTIVGANFGTSARLLRVSMGRRAMRVVSVQDDRLVVEVPRGARTSRITVEVGTRGGTVTGEEFVVGRRQRVSGLEPSSAMVGAELVIRGEGFPRAAIQVGFAGVRRPIRAQRVSPVELRVIMPAGARTGPVELLLPRGRRVPLGQLTVVATPDGVGVSAIEPECTYVGCPAVLRGHGFDTNVRRNDVRFEGQPVQVRRATATTLEIVLPNSPGNGRFTVDVRRRGRASSPPFFIQRPQ